MSNLIPFQFDTAQVRVIQDENGEPWFVAKDVAAALGYANPSNAVQAHCKAKRNEVIPDSGMTAIIPERDVYRLIMRSKLPAAEQFEEWVVGEVLPSIRKHSGYMTPEKVEEALLNPDTIIPTSWAWLSLRSMVICLSVLAFLSRRSVTACSKL